MWTEGLRAGKKEERERIEEGEKNASMEQDNVVRKYCKLQRVS